MSSNPVQPAAGKEVERFREAKLALPFTHYSSADWAKRPGTVAGDPTLRSSCEVPAPRRVRRNSKKQRRRVATQQRRKGETR